MYPAPCLEHHLPQATRPVTAYFSPRSMHVCAKQKNAQAVCHLMYECICMYQCFLIHSFLQRTRRLLRQANIVYTLLYTAFTLTHMDTLEATCSLVSCPRTLEMLSGEGGNQTTNNLVASSSSWASAALPMTSLHIFFQLWKSLKITDAIFYL